MNYVKSRIVVVVEIIIWIASIILDEIIPLKSVCFETLSELFFNFITVVVGFWVTCYLLFVELYKDRYPFAVANRKFVPRMKKGLMYVGISLLFGCVAIIRKDGIFENIVFLLSGIIAIAIIAHLVFDMSKNMMVSTYIEDYCEEILKNLKKEDVDVVKNTVKELQGVLEECVIREEYAVAQKISNCSGEVFRKFLREYVELLQRGNSIESIEKSFKRIVKLGVQQLYICDDINSELLVSEIVTQQIKNIEFCIDAKLFEWYKLYVNEFTELIYKSQQENKEKVIQKLFEICTCILSKTIKQDKKEWAHYLIDEVYEITSFIGHTSKNLYDRYFIKFIAYGLWEANEDDKLYEDMFGIFEKYTFMLDRYNKGFEESILGYVFLFNELLKGKKEKRIEQFMELIFAGMDSDCNDSSWIEFKFFCINQLSEKKMMKDTALNDYHIKIINQIIEMKGSYKGGYSLPKFKMNIYDGMPTKEKIEKICKDIEYLLNRSIISDNLEFFYYIMRVLNDCIESSNINQKDIQIALFDIYVWLVHRTRRLSNRQFEEIVFDSIKEIIEKLDDNKKISDAFGDKIIKEIVELAKNSDSNDDTVIIQTVELLFDFIDDKKNYRFVLKKEKRKTVGKGIYNIGVNCIENDCEDGLRKASNALGWFITKSIEQGAAELSKYLLELAKKMLDIAIDMDISRKTQTFLVTLFTTVGMFCCKEPQYKSYMEVILEEVKKLDKKILDTAISIRTYENDMFCDLFDNKTEQYAKAFQIQYNKICKK